MSEDERWLIKLADLAPEEQGGSLVAAESEVIWHLWRTKQAPWSRVQDGQTVYVVNRRLNRIFWELRVRHVRREVYRSLPEALDILLESYGVFPEDLPTEYLAGRPESGFLLAWASEVVSDLDLPVHPEIDFARAGAHTGYLPLSKVRTEIVERLQLPPVGRPAAAPAAPWAIGENALGLEPHRLDRFVPRHIRQEVVSRGGGRCAQPGCNATDDIHIDHIWPVAKGGGNNIENLQLLCRAHNLAKSAQLVEGAPLPMPFGVAAARAELGVTGPDDDFVLLASAATGDNSRRRIAAILEHEVLRTSEPERYLPAAEQLGELGAEVKALLAYRLEAIGNSGRARELLDSLRASASDEVRAIEALITGSILRNSGQREEARPHLQRALKSEHLEIRGWALVLLASYEVGDARETLLRQAADLPARGPRAVASLSLGDAAAGRGELKAADSWYRRALISDSDDTRADAMIGLARLHLETDVACQYARHALRIASDDHVVAEAHLLLGALGCDQERRLHLNKVLEIGSAEQQQEAEAVIEQLFSTH